ncbi:hypothetical protein V6Z12_D05G220700 [Gossypium hirsutum]
MRYTRTLQKMPFWMTLLKMKLETFSALRIRETL